MTAQDMFNHMKAYFDNNTMRTYEWFDSYNAELCAKPRDLIRERKLQKLADYIADIK